MKTIIRLVLIAAVVIFFLIMFAPSFVGNIANVGLNSVDAKAYGSAQFIPNSVPGQGGNLQVNMQGLKSQFQYVVTLEQGQCGGNVLATLGHFTPDGNGQLTKTAPLKDISSALLQQSLWVNVHQGSTTGPSIACGQVQVNNLVRPLAATVTPASPRIVATTTPSTDSNLFPMLSGNGVNGFPQTGVAPAKNGSYDNYKFPRKF